MSEVVKVVEWTKPKNTNVFILDDAYAWLPARIVEPTSDIPPSTMEVAITLPGNWRETTVLSPDSTILDLEEETVESMHRVLKQKDYPKAGVPLQNLDSNGLPLFKPDMADLPNLFEAAILYNIKERHYHYQPYTRVGDIIVAMNPFTWIDNLYSERTRNLYAKNLVWGETKSVDEPVVTTFGDMYERLGYDPHVYEISCLAYRGLAMDRQNQTILVTGESGAGKTETVKIVMSHLATLEETRPGAEKHKKQNKDIVRRVLESSPVFEAFGNAKTLRNDNSSRFGKFTQLQFAVEHNDNALQIGRYIPNCQLAGSTFITYLLEKSRVVSHSSGERTYHIFYQLLAAPDHFKTKLWEHLGGTTLESFCYTTPVHDAKVKVVETEPPKGESDADLWKVTLNALEIFEYEGESLNTLLRALCVVLQLGNLTFAEDASSKTIEGVTVISSRDELAKLVDITGIPAETLEAAMTTRVLKTASDEVSVRLRPPVAKDVCDALAKEIYARIFDMLVRSINEHSDAKVDKKKLGNVSLLDIFGFERFQVNRFEQLSINYANEQLQYKYVVDNFKKVKEEYEAEGIQIFEFALVDNSDVLELLQGRLGLINSLNEECIRPKGNDASFVYKIKIIHKEDDCLIDKKLHRRTEFGIRHFAGPVTYDSTQFVERNMDKLPPDLLECATKSTNTLIREEFEKLIAATQAPPVTASRHRKKVATPTVLEKFRRQLKDLMNIMEGTSTRYIRCIKPNDAKAPRLTDHLTTMRQLECAGLVTAIIISRESFPNKLTYTSIRSRFDCLLTDERRAAMADMEEQEAVRYMLPKLLSPLVEKDTGKKHAIPYDFGKTKVYFRAGALEYLETERVNFYSKRALIIQKWMRSLQGKVHYSEMRQAAIKIQTFVRGRIGHQTYQKKQNAAVTLQTWIRGTQAATRFNNIRRNKAATLLQSRIRTKLLTVKASAYKQSARVIQRAFRNKDSRNKLSTKLTLIVEEARMNGKLLKLRDQVEVLRSSVKKDPTTMPKNINDGTLGQVESVLDYLRKEILALRTKNTELKAELRNSEREKRELLARFDGANAAASSSRLEVAQLTKITQSLTSDITHCKQELTTTRRQLKSTKSSRIEQVSAIKVDHERALKDRDLEIAALQKTIKDGWLACDREKKALRSEIERLETEHMREVLHLKQELRRTQDSHNDYMGKLMDVLDTTHTVREQETARITVELDAVKEEKDSQILALQREVEQLRDATMADVGALQETMRSKVTEVTLVRREIEGGSAARIQRNSQFEEVCARLSESVSPDNLVSIMSAPRVKWRKVSVLEEESAKMKDMIDVLKEIYESEGSAQIKFDEGTLKLLDNYLMAAEPNEMLEKLQARVSDLEAENKRLEEEDSAESWRREARDRRREDSQRSEIDMEVHV